MNAPMRRGACPSLSGPMQTGDGLLVRLRPLGGGLSPQQLGRLADAAGRFGNGILEVTRRGNLQIRGLSAESAVEFAKAVDAIGIAVTSGIPVETGPLAGLDATEVADPRPLAQAIREAIDEAGLALRLGPKVSVVVDSGGALPMGDVAADVRLVAQRQGRWRLSAGGTAKEAGYAGPVTEAEAVKAVLFLLEAIAAKGLPARGRDLSLGDISGPVERVPSPVGMFGLAEGSLALGVGLPYGQTNAGILHAFADMAAACGAAKIRFAPGKALLAIGLSADEFDKLKEAALSLGFVTDPADARLFIAACAGSPACRSAFIATKEVAADIARSASDLLDGSFILHLSGCPKGCARPAWPALSLVGVAPGRCDLLSGADEDAAIVQTAGGDAAARVAELALLFHQQRREGETARAFLDRLGGSGLAAHLSINRA